MKATRLTSVLESSRGADNYIDEPCMVYHSPPPLANEVGSTTYLMPTQCVLLSALDDESFNYLYIPKSLHGRLPRDFKHKHTSAMYGDSSPLTYFYSLNVYRPRSV